MRIETWLMPLAVNLFIVALLELFVFIVHKKAFADPFHKNDVGVVTVLNAPSLRMTDGYLNIKLNILLKAAVFLIFAIAAHFTKNNIRIVTVSLYVIPLLLSFRVFRTRYRQYNASYEYQTNDPNYRDTVERLHEVLHSEFYAACTLFVYSVLSYLCLLSFLFVDLERHVITMSIPETCLFINALFVSAIVIIYCAAKNNNGIGD